MDPVSFSKEVALSAEEIFLSCSTCRDYNISEANRMARFALLVHDFFFFSPRTLGFPSFSFRLVSVVFRGANR